MLSQFSPVPSNLRRQFVNMWHRCASLLNAFLTWMRKCYARLSSEGCCHQSRRMSFNMATTSSHSNKWLNMGKIAEVAGLTSPTIAYGQLNDIARELKTTGAEARELTTRMNTLTMSTINSISSQSPTRQVSFDQSGRPRSPAPTRRYRDDFERPTTPPRYYNNSMCN